MMPLSYSKRVQILPQHRPLWASLIFAAVLTGLWSLLPAPAHAQDPNNAPVVGTNAVLYDGALGGTPDSQQFTYIDASFGAAGNTASGGVTTLDTTSANGISAGYFRNYPADSGWPTLSRATGYTIKFSAQLVSESHANNNRAGFSVIALSSDLQGIEIGFWEDEIWAQHDDTTGSLFTHAEGVIPTSSITNTLVPYELTILGDRYSLSISHTEVLTGPLRDYTAFAGFPDVYESPNFIFLGDNTTSAQAEVQISTVSVITNSTPPDRSVDSGQPLVINDIGLLDVDAYGSSQVVTLTVSHGTLDLSDSVPNGLTAANISGNGTAQLVLTGPLGQINTSLVYSPVLTYTSQTNFNGVDTLVVAINDQGNTGPGGALSDSKGFDITVQAFADLQLTKINSAGPLSAGSLLTYTLTVTNTGPNTVTNVTISDTVPTGVIYAPGSIAGGDSRNDSNAPLLSWTVSSLATNTPVTFTFATTVSNSVADGTTITNIAAATSTEIVQPVTATAVITISSEVTTVRPIYLPVIIKSSLTLEVP